ncbi:4'-phosphopantetheinyl transferase superfamily protein [Kitasatospora sp. MBT63]|uniref:4'-phosphopantetheinyl transferase family protein n=1 Tax=Kitasatospora sp. MBT63 TaxID=1444768 RepID=UPI0007C742DC|nr:4'-phosphopantetheinyl transferase superfamily protein [Kitasatospora sp. MBT63]
MTGARTDCAPRTHRGDEVRLWICANDDLGPGMATALAGHWLDEHELATADRFVFERDRRQYLVAHVMVRRLLSLETGVPEALVELRRSDRGRPSLRPPDGGLRCGHGELDFNLSHAHGYNAIVVARGRRVGVDVERFDRVGGRALEGIAESFTPGERRQLAGLPAGGVRDRAVLRLWTLKEAYSKARGLGLGLPFDSFGFVLSGSDRVLAFEPPADDPAGRWSFLALEPEPDLLLSVAVEAGAEPPRAVHLHGGFPWRPAALRDSFTPGHPAPLLTPGTLSVPGTAAPAAARPGPVRPGPAGTPPHHTEAPRSAA